jgi:hypothetical protein
MGWSTSYKLYLPHPINNFDHEKVDKWGDNQDKFFHINYQRYQYTRNTIIYVTIKYGKYDIEKFVKMLENEYHIDCDITIVSTDEFEWPDWKSHYIDDDEYIAR